MVDRELLAKGIADIRDAVSRIREVLPADAVAFERDRTAREIVVLNLFVALQACLSLATHWLADEGMAVPASYRDVFRTLGERFVLPADLADRLALAAGLRNLIAHRDGALDGRRIHAVAATDLDDLLAFCSALAQRA